MVLIDKKTLVPALMDEKNALAFDVFVDSQQTLSADGQFLMMLKVKCQMTVWEELQKTRQLVSV
ncbi:MAG: hypothetical protein ACKPKO_24615, partial [Candidatus Fonsibacter sp.]